MLSTDQFTDLVFIIALHIYLKINVSIERTRTHTNNSEVLTRPPRLHIVGSASTSRISTPFSYIIIVHVRIKKHFTCNKICWDLGRKGELMLKHFSSNFLYVIQKVTILV